MSDTTKSNVLLITPDLRQVQTDRVSVSSVVDDTTYTITINSVDYTFLSDSSATEAEIIAGLVLAVNTDCTTVTATDNTTYITLAANVSGRPYTVAVDSNLATVNLTEPSVVLDDVWTLLLADAALEITVAEYGDNEEVVQRYLVAHLITKAAETGTSGIVTREKTGPIEKEYKVSTDTVGNTDYNSTRYGQRFLQLYKKYRLLRVI